MLSASLTACNVAASVSNCCLWRCSAHDAFRPVVASCPVYLLITISSMALTALGVAFSVSDSLFVALLQLYGAFCRQGLMALQLSDSTGGCGWRCFTGCRSYAALTAFGVAASVSEVLFVALLSWVNPFSVSVASGWLRERACSAIFSSCSPWSAELLLCHDQFHHGVGGTVITAWNICARPEPSSLVGLHFQRYFLPQHCTCIIKHTNFTHPESAGFRRNDQFGDEAVRVLRVGEDAVDRLAPNLIVKRCLVFLRLTKLSIAVPYKLCA